MKIDAMNNKTTLGVYKFDENVLNCSLISLLLMYTAE